MVLVAGLLALPLNSWAKTEIIWWHAMGGFLGERVNDITNKFNASQNEYEVKAIYKGGYPETLDRGNCRLPGQDPSSHHSGF